MEAKKRQPPKQLQGILWSHDVNDLKIKEDKYYIVHQILRYGTMGELNWLFNTYSKSNIKDVFINQPAKIYSPSSFHFVRHYILPLSDVYLKPNSYVENIPRNIRS